MVTKKTDKSRTRRAVKAIFRPRLETMREGKMPTLNVNGCFNQYSLHALFEKLHVLHAH